ncbi:MAG: chloride channel protein [Gemmataceae bacterium]
MTDRAASSLRLNPLIWLPEFWQIGRRRLRPQARLLALSLCVGVIAGLGAVVFYLATRIVFYLLLEMIVGYHPGGPANEPSLDLFLPPSTTPFHWWLLLIVPAAGGLLSGFLVYTFAPEAEGHGTDSAIAAYHFKGGVIRPRVPLVKIIASALTLGSGGSGGREGPIAQIGAGFGSWLGGLLRLRPAERRLLLAAGMGAGIAAIFRAPLAGALFAAEVLYRSPDFESEVVIPAALACISAYCTFGLIFSHWTGIGWKPLFDMPVDLMQSTAFTDPFHLIPYLLLALFVVVLAMLYTRSFYGLTELFRRIPLAPHFKPAIGAFLSALVALALYFTLKHNRALSVLSFGYGILQDSLKRLPSESTDLSLAVLLMCIAVGKIVTTGLTIGSGGSGGVFGPSMVIGGCGGGALGILLNRVFPAGYMPPPASFVIVGMAGFFAAAAKTPLSTLVMVSELTGNYNLLLPTLWVCTIAFLLSDEQSIYSSQVQSRSRSPAHQGAYVREVLTGLKVSSFITPLSEVPYLNPGDRLADVIDRLTSSPYQSAPVIDPEGRLLGVVTGEEVLLASQSPHLRTLLVAEDLLRAVAPLSPDDPLDQAMEQFVESDLLTLPVVENTENKRVLGIVKRADLSGTYLRQIQGTQPPTMPAKVEPEME